MNGKNILNTILISSRIPLAKIILWRRLANLVDRKYVKCNGVTYCITDKGLNYLQSAEDTNPSPTINKENRLNRDIEFFNKEGYY